MSRPADQVLKGLLMPDLRIQCRARGLTPAGGPEQLRARLKEHMDSTGDYQIYPDPAGGADPQSGLPPRSNSRGAISQMHFERQDGYGGAPGGYGAPPPSYGGPQGYGAPPSGGYGGGGGGGGYGGGGGGGGYGAPPPQMDPYGGAPQQGPMYGRRNSMGSRGDPNGPPGQGGPGAGGPMGSVMNMGVGFDIGGPPQGRRSGDPPAPNRDGRAAGTAPGQREAFSFGPYNVFKDEGGSRTNGGGDGRPPALQPPRDARESDSARFLQMSPNQAAAASRAAQQKGSMSLGADPAYSEYSGGSPGYSGGRPPAGPGGYGVAGPDMMAGVGRERAAAYGSPARGPPPPVYPPAAGGGGDGGPMSPMDIDKMLRGMTLNDLRTELRARGLQPGGGQQELQARLKEVMVGGGGAPPAYGGGGGGGGAGMYGGGGGGPSYGGPPGGSQASMNAIGGGGRSGGNNYARPNGCQNVGNFISDRPTSRVLAPPGGKSQITFC